MAAAGAAAVAMWVSTALATASTVYAAVSARNQAKAQSKQAEQNARNAESQGRVEAKRRVLNMVAAMDEEGFGNCSNTGACEIECPKGISLENIARMNREFLTASLDKK